MVDTKGRAIRCEYFYGNKISDYGLKWGYVDYGTLAKAFDAVLCNNIISMTDYVSLPNGEYSEWVCENGCDYDEETEEYSEIFQYYIISSSGAEILEYWTDEIVFYNEALDMYVWGVTHFGTSWDYVLTDIKIEKDEDNG